MEAFPLLSLEANPLICSKIEEHHKLCETFSEEVEALKTKSVLELFTLKEHLEKLFENARASPISSDTLKGILKPVELMVTLCRSTLMAPFEPPSYT